MALVNKTGCCDCGQLITACNCGNASATTQCRFKSGSAEICGIPEFVDPPEHWYRKRTTSGLMTLSKYLDNVCEGVISVGASLECRSKSGTATLVGVREFANPSVPARVYRSNGAGGSITRMQGGGCGTQTGVRIWSGAIVYDSATGTPTDNRCMTLNGGACNPTGAPGAGQVPSETGWMNPANITNAGCGAPPTNYSTFADKTSAQATGSGVCINCGAGGNFQDTGESTALLTDEDLPSDAVNRAIAAIGAWTDATCSASSSFQTPATGTNISFTFRYGQTRFVVTSGLTSGANYEGRIHVAKRVAGSGAAFVDTGSPIVVMFAASGAGHTSDWQDLPNESGWEFMATGVEVFGEIEELIQDNWDIVEEFGADTCAQIVTDNSERSVDGSPDTGPFDQTPPNAYGGHVDVTTSPTLRTTAGKDECNSDGAGAYLQANGTVQEQLDDEDTDQDAITRAMDAITDWVDGGCTLPAFITGRTPGNTVFGFRWLNVRAALVGMGAGPGTPKTFRITWRTFRRANGTSDPYQFYSELIQEVSAVADTMTSDWVDVPNEAGWDTMVAGTPKVVQVA